MKKKKEHQKNLYQMANKVLKLYIFLDNQKLGSSVQFTQIKNIPNTITCLLVKLFLEEMVYSYYETA